MYPTFWDTQKCISNNKDILSQVVVEWKMKQQNSYPQILGIGLVELWDMENKGDYSKKVDKPCKAKKVVVSME